LAAQAAEAAGALGGNDGYWRMHDWLLANRKNLTPEAIRAAAAGLGLDAEALMARIESPEVANAVRAACVDAGSPKFIPAVYVNAKFVPRWRLEGHDIMGEICAQAARDALTANAGSAASAPR
jgi:hypothetical protein